MVISIYWPVLAAVLALHFITYFISTRFLIVISSIRINITAQGCDQQKNKK